MKFLISLTQWYGSKCHAIVPNTDYFKPIILKFKIFIYNSNSKVIYNLCLCGGNILFVREGEVFPTEKEIFNTGIFRKNTSKYAKLMAELHACGSLKQI